MRNTLLVAPVEAKLFREWAGRKHALKVAGAVRSKAVRSVGRGLGVISGLMDSWGAILDRSKSLDQGDEAAACFHLLTALGGSLLVAGALLGPVFPAALLWTAALGQVLELVGTVGSAAAAGSDLEVWLRFCHFGRLNARHEARAIPDWANGDSLGRIARSPTLQIQALCRIIYQMEVELGIIEYARIAEPQLSVVVKFPYGYPQDGQLYMRMQVNGIDGNDRVFRPLSPWPKVRPLAHYRNTQTQESALYDAGSILIGAKAITISVCLDINGRREFHPDRPITMTFLVDDLKRVKA